MVHKSVHDILLSLLHLMKACGIIMQFGDLKHNYSYLIFYCNIHKAYSLNQNV